MIIYIFY